jgi:hypothetical protein
VPQPHISGITELGGTGPIANLIEYSLGFQVIAPERTIEWRIERLDRPGIQNLRMGNSTVDLICARREHGAARSSCKRKN